MKIVVCIKTTLPSEAQVRVENGRITWDEIPLIINPWDEYAVEAALQQKELHGGSVTALSIGNETANIALRHALAMGADEAVHISDPQAANLDTQSTACLLAAAIRKLGGVEMAFFGRQAIDNDAGLTAAQTARLLGWPALTLASVIQVEGQRVRVERAVEEGWQIVSAALPVVLSISKDFAEPRYPTFLNKRKADRAVIPTWSLADLGLPAPTPLISWGEPTSPPVPQTTCEMLAGTPEEIAASLVRKPAAGKIL